MASEEGIHDLVLAGDADAALGLAVALRSLAEVAGDSRYRVTLLTDGIDDAGRGRIQGVVEASPASLPELRFVEMGSRVPDALARAGRLPRGAYLRLFLADSVEAARAVYVDYDVLFRRDPAPLFEVDLEGHALGAVRNIGQPCMASRAVFPGWRTLGYAPDTPFLNSGLLVVDLERWREEGIAEQAVAWALEHPGFFREDQGILNAILVDRWKSLPLQWNSQPSVYSDPPESALFLDLGELDRAREEPWIVHFAGRRKKPWLADCDHPLTEAWRSRAAALGWTPPVPKRKRRSLKRRVKDGVRSAVRGSASSAEELARARRAAKVFGPRALGWALRNRTPGLPRRTELESCLHAILARRGRVTVVQIGAHVGNLNDPLFRFIREVNDGRREPACRAVLVEPVGPLFEQLQANYADCPGVAFANVAIADRPGTQTFHRIDPDVDLERHGMPHWLSQIGSLVPERLEKEMARADKGRGIPEFIAQHLIREEVTCVTFEELLERFGLREVDFLQIDAEGYDYEILRSIDFKRVKPRMINYERVHLQEDEPACRRLLEDQGYALYDHRRMDTLAVLRPARLFARG